MRSHLAKKIPAAVLALIMTLCVVGGLFGEKIAMAAAADAATITPSGNTNINEGASGTINASLNGAAPVHAGGALSYAWSVSGDTFVQVVNSSTAAQDVTYNAAAGTAGQTATVRCTVTETYDPGGGSTTEVSFKEFSITVLAPSITSITGTVSPTSGTAYAIVPNSGNCIRFRCVPTGGDGNYTYSWDVSAGSTSVLAKYADVAGTGGSQHDFRVIGTGTATVTCTVTDGAGSSNTILSTQITNSTAVPTTQFYITNKPSSPIYVGDRIDLSFFNTTGSAVTVTSNNTSSISILGHQLCADREGANVTITATAGSMHDDFTVTVQRKTPSILWYNNPDVASRGATYTSTDNINKARSDYDTTANMYWTLTSAPGTTGYSFNTTTGALSFGSTAVLGNYVVTLNMGETTKYRAANMSFTIELRSSVAISVTPTTVKMTTTGLAQTITVTTDPTTAGGLDITATTSRSDGNPVVSVSAVTNTTNGYYFTITGMTVGYATVRVRAVNGGNSIPISVQVGNPSPVMTVTYSPNVTALGKGDYTIMTVHVDSPDSNSVKLTRGNVRIYAEGYNYSHPSTNTYYSTLDANGNATFTIRPQYTGTVTLTAESGSTSASRTFTVSGYPTLPQTGPDYTAIYIVSGLGLAVAATAVTLNARKKRKDEQAF